MIPSSFMAPAGDWSLFLFPLAICNVLHGRVGFFLYIKIIYKNCSDIFFTLKHTKKLRIKHFIVYH
jgi:hypothetical protein